MHRLVYYSANRIVGSASELAVQIDQILRASRRNNAQAGVTGALMFSEGFFGQVLEGSQAAVEATFERIQRDTRHGDVSLLEFRSIELRSFDNWSMAFVGRQSNEAFDAIRRSSGHDPEAMRAERLLVRLIELVEGEMV